MKETLIKVMSVALGWLLGFFGVFVSVFSDGPIGERIVAVLVVLVIYAALSFLLGFSLKAKGLIWSLMLMLPGIAILIVYALKEPDFLYYAYAGAIAAISLIFAFIGSRFKFRKERK